MRPLGRETEFVRAIPGSQRGQTTIDYVIGLSIFLVVIVFVLGFLPTIFAPFEADTGGSTILADRSADRLASDLLVESPDKPAVLDQECTTEFFDADTNVPSDCRYDVDGADLSTALGTDQFTNLNVTVRSGETISQIDGTSLAVGDSPEGNENVVVANRVVFVAGDQHQLYVRVW